MPSESIIDGQSVYADGSQIFQPFRALGYVSDHVPVSIQQRGQENYITTSIGNSFHIYDSKKLNLLFVGPQLAENINCMCSHNDFTIVACGGNIIWFHRGKKVRGIVAHEASIHLMITFGENIISVCENNVVRIHSINDGELISEMEIPADTFQITTIMHPSTYLNKIMFGSRQGKMQLWNIRTQKMIHEFKGWGSEIISCVQAPAIDVVGCGLLDGRIIIHNLKFDLKIMTFSQEYGPVTALSFRTDEHPVLASTAGGRIVLWDLLQRKIMTTVQDPHESQVSSLEFLHGQPVLVSSGSDNSLKMWIFDQVDSIPRLLRSRSGHSAPPSRLQFYDDDGKFLLSAGMDKSLRMVSSVRDAQNVELSQGSISKKAKQLRISASELKLPPIVQFDASTTRERDWDNIVTCHLNTLEAKTWKYNDRTIGQHSLSPPKIVENESHSGRDVVAKAVCMSTCGNFCFVGLSNGQINKYNIQSGLHRGMYGNPAHLNSIRGLCTDAINSVLISAAADSRIKFWDFNKRKCLGTLATTSTVSMLRVQRTTSIVAAAFDDFNVALYDIESRTCVRVFKGHTNRITDIAFSPDGRWCVSASMDGSVRVWDIPAGRLLDGFLVRAPVTSLSFSPTSQFLATTHIDNLGIYLWANKTLFSNASVKFLAPDFEPVYVDLPTVGDFELEKAEETKQQKKKRTSKIHKDKEEQMRKANNDMEVDVDSNDDDSHSDSGNGSASDAEAEDKNAIDEDLSIWTTPAQLGDKLITLSDRDSSYWQTLSNLALIKQRNRPKEAPQAAPAAPFFLPTTKELKPTFVKDDETDDLKNTLAQQKNSKILNFGGLDLSTEFVLLLKKCFEEEDYEPMWPVLNEMSPSAVDVELRTLSTLKPMEYFLHFIDCELGTGKNFEILQAYLSIFLKLHGQIIAENEELVQMLDAIQEHHNSAWERVSHLMNHSMCLVSFMKNV